MIIGFVDKPDKPKTTKFDKTRKVTIIFLPHIITKFLKPGKVVNKHKSTDAWTHSNLN